MMKTALSAVAAAASLVAAASATYVEIRFDTTAGNESPGALRPIAGPDGLPANPAYFTLSASELGFGPEVDGELVLKVSCARTDGSDCDLVRDDEGLGVLGGRGDSADVDGFGPDESIKVEFSGDFDVSLFRFDIDDIDSNDDLIVSINDESISDLPGGFTVNCNVPDPGPNDECGVNILGGVLIDTFEIAANDRNDDFRLEAFKLYLHGSEEVPLPGAAILFGSALAAGFARRKQRNSKVAA